MSKTKPSNVVRLDEHPSSPRFSDQTRPGALLKHCRELASSTLITALPAVMDKLDDALFDLANRSSSNDEQSVYFETMRQVRVKRASIESEFRRFFKESVQSSIERIAGASHESSLTDVSSADLGLVEEQDFEESLAVTNTVRKIRSSCQQPLYALERRIAELLEVEVFEPKDNPFGPEAMCDAFKDACSQIEADVEIRLIIFKLFDRHLSAQAEELYCRVNDYLVSEGVLPEIRHHVKIQPSAPQPNDPSAYAQLASGSGAAGSQAEGLTEPSTGPAPQFQAPAGQPASPNAPSLAPQPYIATTSAALLDTLRQVMDVNFVARTASHTPGEVERRIIDQLTHLQHGNTGEARGNIASLDLSGVHTGTVNVLRDLKQSTVDNGVGEMDAMMFDVVAMMFDFILDDKKIPSPMKALIGRLQIPMLKVAILDKALFARKFHPARKFLNTIAEAAVGWSENQYRNDALYTKLESMVERILDEFDERVDVFADVLEELEGFLQQEDSKAESSASTIANAIQGRERLTIARRNAEEQINHCLEKTSVHRVVREFLISHWKELLFIRHFEEGDNGDGWLGAIETMDDLVWSVAPKTLDHDRKHLTDILPALLRRVRDGMQQLGISSKVSSAFLGALKKLHIAAIRNQNFIGDPDDVEEVSGDSEARLAEEIVSADLDSDGIDFQWPNKSNYSVEELSLIQLAIERANEAIYGAAEARPECAGMGTTLVAVQFHDDRLTAAHVGDARLYRQRGDVFRRLTADHSLRQQLVNKGIYTAGEVEEKVQKNIITRAVGPEARVDVEVQEIETEPDDLYLLCSDGLTDMVDDVELSEILSDQHTDLATACRMLVDAANENGGSDNISVVLARVRDSDAAPPRIEMHGLTDVGRKRSRNEDHIAVDSEFGVAIVADGMGGCNAGEIASEMAVKIIIEALRSGSVDSIGIETIDSEIAYEPDEEDEYTEIVRNMDVGSWVEFYHVDGSTTRARLTWTSPVTGRYLFTDRKGMKVADATVHGLAVELKRGSVSIIEDVPLFDRIIGTMKEHLHADGMAAH